MNPLRSSVCFATGVDRAKQDSREKAVGAAAGRQLWGEQAEGALLPLAASGVYSLAPALNLARGQRVEGGLRHCHTSLYEPVYPPAPEPCIPGPQDSAQGWSRMPLDTYSRHGTWLLSMLLQRVTNMENGLGRGPQRKSTGVGQGAWRTLGQPKGAPQDLCQVSGHFVAPCQSVPRLSRCWGVGR